MAEDQLSQAIRHAKAGEKEEARQIITHYLRDNPQDARAWMVMAQVVKDKEQAVDCLRRVIRYADNENLRQWAIDNLARLEQPPSFPAPTAEEQPLSQSVPAPPPPSIKPETKTRRFRWVHACGIVAVILILGVVGCTVVTGIGFGQLVQLVNKLPTPPPQPTLVVGETYWIGALQPPGGILEGLTTTYAIVNNKPGSSLDDPGITIVGILQDATPVTLIGIENEFCYIEATNEFNSPVEGWLSCSRLLDYQPTPFPTPNLTPERPS